MVSNPRRRHTPVNWTYDADHVSESRDDWLLAPTVVYGYNVPERRWGECNCICLVCRTQLMTPTTAAAFDINGDFQYYPQDLVVLTGDQCHPPRLTGVDISDYGMTRTHAWINGISRKAIGQDGQGLLLIMYGRGSFAETRALRERTTDSAGHCTRSPPVELPTYPQNLKSSERPSAATQSLSSTM